MRESPVFHELCMFHSTVVYDIFDIDIVVSSDSIFDIAVYSQPKHLSSTVFDFHDAKMAIM